MLFARSSKAHAAPFTFLDPGLLHDGELMLQLRETTPAIAERAPTYRFEMVRRGTGEKLGAIELRIGNSQDILLYTGHIGYRVDEPHRGRRLATRGCRLLFPLAKQHGLRDLWLTCDPDNLPSYRTCELIGGQLISTVPVPKSHAYYESGSREKCRFLVKL